MEIRSHVCSTGRRANWRPHLGQTYLEDMTESTRTVPRPSGGMPDLRRPPRATIFLSWHVVNPSIAFAFKPGRRLRPSQPPFPHTRPCLLRAAGMPSTLSFHSFRGTLDAV